MDIFLIGMITAVKFVVSEVCEVMGLTSSFGALVFRMKDNNCSALSQSDLSKSILISPGNPPPGNCRKYNAVLWEYALIKKKNVFQLPDSTSKEQR